MESILLGKRKRSEQREGLRKDTKLRSTPLQCPICDVTLRPESLTQHYEQELARLEQLQPHSAHHRRQREPHPSTSSSTAEDGTEGEGGILSFAKKTLESVQRRRFIFEHRSCDQSSSLPQQSQSSNSGAGGSNSGAGGSSREICPVCNVPLPTDGGEATHVDACLEQQRRALEDGMLTLSSLNSDNDSSGSEEYEEYTWCNMTRIRTTSLLSPQTRASMFNASVISRPSDTSFEEAVDVEEDTSALYGPPQFTEDDILTVSESEEPNKDERSERSPGSDGIAPSSLDPHSEKKNIPQCLICMDHYDKPLVSVQCWHVYCERCWLKALKAQKLCPKCKTITCSSDLRRIFL